MSHKRMALLLGLTLLILTGLGISHFVFLSNLNQLSHQKTRLESRQIILEGLVENLAETRLLFGTIPAMVTTPLQRREYLQRLQTKIRNLNTIVQILKEGGTYHTTLMLNLPGIEHDEQDFHILPFSSKEMGPLNASLKQIHTYEKDLETLLAPIQQSDFFSLSLERLHTIRTHLAITIKKQDAFFRRTAENINHLFYINRHLLQHTNRKLHQNETYFRIAIFLMSVVLLLLILGASYITLRRFVLLNSALKEKLYIDELTGTHNRSALESRSFGPYSIVYMVDIDDFSGTNSLYGTHIGDRLLQEVARRLYSNCGTCYIHRFGGDVFALMAYDLRETDLSIKKRIAFVKDLIEGKAFSVEGEKIHLSITIGVGVGIQAVAQAMLALDIAKIEEKSYKIYSRRNRFTRELKEQRRWKQIITQAIKEDRVVPFVQPIVDRNGAIFRYECLMRIAQPTGSGTDYLPPLFLDTAKKIKLYPRLSRLIIQKSFEMFRHGGNFSINLSYLDIKEHTTRFFLEEMIERYRAHGRIMFEILEHESIDDFRQVETFVEHFRELGVQIAIDDFGSEYSNLMEIIRIRPDYLKIDGSLIRNIHTRHNAYLAVRSISEFARDLGMWTVAEYVHDRETFLACKEIGIDYFQGYYFSQAVRTVREIPLQPDGSIRPAGL